MPIFWVSPVTAKVLSAGNVVAATYVETRPEPLPGAVGFFFDILAVGPVLGFQLFYIFNVLQSPYPLFQILDTHRDPHYTHMASLR